MPRKDDLNKLITEHQRRLQKLEIQKARLGINAPPEILIEIEDIEAETERLQTELKALEGGGVHGKSQRAMVPAETTYAIDSTADRPNTSPVDFVIVTALEEERDAVLDKLPGYQKPGPFSDDVRIYFFSSLPVTFPDGSPGTYRVVVMPLLGMGRVQATVATSDAIRQWNPRYVILVGIAGGVAENGVKLGDILISDQIVDYELQKLTPEGPQVRWEVHRADPRLVGAARNFDDSSWQELVKTKRPVRGTPTRHIGPIASGDKVVAFSKVLKKYRKVWLKLIGVEMEAAGVATAAFQAAKPPGFFMVRGVSDLADEEKGSSRVKKWRSYACDVAASYTVALLKSGPVVLSSGDVSKGSPAPESLDTRILKALYINYQQHRGNPQMSFNELTKACEAEQTDVIQCLYGLREKEWLAFDLTDRAESGVVWLTQLGIKVARDISEAQSLRKNG
jgi:nucleoside phosphorylase